MAGPHWIKAAKGTTAPSTIIAVCPAERTFRPRDSMGVRHISLDRIHAAIIHRRRGPWSDVREVEFPLVDDWWEWLETETPRHRRIHVFTPSCSQTFILSDLYGRFAEHGAKWSAASPDPLAVLRSAGLAGGPNAKKRPRTRKAPEPPSREYVVNTLHLGGPTEIVRWSTNGRSYQWTNWTQYGVTNERDVAAAVGWRHERDGGLVPDDPATPFPADLRARLWCRWMASLSDWWRREDGGPWGASVAGCAYSYLRRRLPEKSILQHDSADVAELEEQALHAGRRSVWFYGNVGSKADWKENGIDPPPRSQHGSAPAGMLNVDVKSMYPTLLTREDYPVRLYDLRRGPSPELVLAALRSHAVIARVQLMTEAAEYPLRTDRGIRYPTGRFHCTLAGPELRRALEAGHVEKIALAAVYSTGRPFANACQRLIDIRDRYKLGPSTAMETFMKQLANSLSGRLAMRGNSLVPRPGLPPKMDWGSWGHTDMSTGERQSFVAVAGLTLERIEREARARPMTAAYCHLTSYGRVLMSDVRAAFPARTVYAMDTDGLWVRSTPEVESVVRGLANIRGGYSATERHRRVVGRWFGSQHYWTGSEWILSGYNAPKFRPDGKAELVQRSAIVIGRPAAPEATVAEKLIERDYATLAGSDIIGPDGWTVPVRMWHMPDV